MLDGEQKNSTSIINERQVGRVYCQAFENSIKRFF